MGILRCILLLSMFHKAMPPFWFQLFWLVISERDLVLYTVLRRDYLTKGGCNDVFTIYVDFKYTEAIMYTSVIKYVYVT